MNFQNRFIMLDEVTSTNDYLKDNFLSLENGTCVTAKLQTAGRGRSGRRWIDKKGNNVALSMLVKDIDGDVNISAITLVAAASVYKVLSKMGISPKIKWPNDTIVDGKKISGILTEGISYGENIACIIIGIGINCNQVTFPPELKATSIKNELGYEVITEDIALELGNELKKDVELFLKGDNSFLNIIRENLYFKNELITYKKNNRTGFSGRVIDVDDDGCLIVDDNGKRIKLLSGEIKNLRS